jgi:putative flippase GtrA
LRTSWKQLWLKHETKWRFLLVGIWNTIFGYLAYVGLDYLFTFVFQKRYVAYMTAAVVSNIIATISAFIFHKHITFKSTVRGKAVIIEFFKFYSMYTVTNILGLVLLPFFVEVMKIDPKIAGALLIPVVAIISYFGHSRFSFVNGAGTKDKIE